MPSRITDGFSRMLEDPTYESVVRWGNEGDSFVVLEVGDPRRDSRYSEILTAATEREIHKVDPSQAFQTQQLCQFRPTTQQVRLPQGAAEQ